MKFANLVLRRVVAMRATQNEGDTNGMVTRNSQSMTKSMAF